MQGVSDSPFIYSRFIKYLYEAGGSAVPFSPNSLPTKMREKEVMLSDEEHRLLKEYKKAEYPDHTPFGFILGQLIAEKLE